MQGMNYLAIVVAAVAAFVASVVWYALFGNAMTELREADPPPQPTRERRFDGAVRGCPEPRRRLHGCLLPLASGDHRPQGAVGVGACGFSQPRSCWAPSSTRASP